MHTDTGVCECVYISNFKIHVYLHRIRSTWNCLHLQAQAHMQRNIHMYLYICMHTHTHMHLNTDTCLVTHGCIDILSHI